MALTILAAAALPSLPVMKATIYRDCARNAQRGAPPGMQHLIPEVCTCFVERFSRGKTREQLDATKNQDGSAIGKQCIAQAASRDSAKR